MHTNIFMDSLLYSCLRCLRAHIARLTSSQQKREKKQLNHLLNSNFPSPKHLVLDISGHMIHWDWITPLHLPVTEVHEDTPKAIMYSGWVPTAVKISVALDFWRAEPWLKIYLHTTVAISIQDLRMK